MNKKVNILLILTTILGFVITGYSQGHSQSDYDNGKYISGTDYSHGSGKKGHREVEVVPEANVIKFSLLSWVNGNIPLYYERRVAPWLGLQFGLGLTTRDFVADGVTYIVSGLRDVPPADYNNYAFYANQGRKSSVGFYVSFQPKFYPGRRGLAGFFVSPMVEFKRYDFRASYVDPNVVSDVEQPTYLTTKMGEYRNAVDFTINIGRQWLLPSKVSLEIMAGAGFRKLWEQRRFINESTYAYNPITGNSGYAFTTSTSWYTTFRPEFNLSFIIGGYF